MPSSVFGGAPPRLPPPKSSATVAATPAAKPVLDTVTITSATGDDVLFPGPTLTKVFRNSAMLVHLNWPNPVKRSQLSTSALKTLAGEDVSAIWGAPRPAISPEDCFEIMQAAEMLLIDKLGDSAFQRIEAALSVEKAVAFLGHANAIEGPAAERVKARCAAFICENFDSVMATPSFKEMCESDAACVAFRTDMIAALDERLTAARKKRWDGAQSWAGVEGALMWLLEDAGLDDLDNALGAPSLKDACEADLPRFITWAMTQPHWEGKSEWPLVRRAPMNRAELAKSLLEANPKHHALEALIPYLPEGALEAWAKSDVKVLSAYVARGDLHTVTTHLLPNIAQDKLHLWLNYKNTPLAGAVSGGHHEVLKFLLSKATSWTISSAVDDCSYFRGALAKCDDATWNIIFPPDVRGRSKELSGIDNEVRAKWFEDLDSWCDRDTVASVYKRLLKSPAVRDHGWRSVNFDTCHDSLGYRSIIESGDVAEAKKILGNASNYDRQKMLSADSFSAWRVSAKNGHLSMLRWLREEHPEKFRDMRRSRDHALMHAAIVNNREDVVNFVLEDPTYLPAFLEAMDVRTLSAILVDTGENGHAEMFQRFFLMLSDVRQRDIVQRNDFHLALKIAYTAKKGVWPTLLRFIDGFGLREAMLASNGSDIPWYLAQEAPEHFVALIKDGCSYIIPAMMQRSNWRLQYVGSKLGGKEALELLLAHMPKEKIRELLDADYGKMIKEFKKKKDDTSLIAFLDALKITTLEDLPRSINYGDEPLTPKMRVYLAKLLPTKISDAVNDADLRLASMYGDAKRVAAYVDAFTEQNKPSRQYDQEYQADDPDDPDEVEYLRKMAEDDRRMDERMFDREKRSMFRDVVDNGALLSAALQGDAAKVEALMRLAPTGQLPGWVNSRLVDVAYQALSRGYVAAHAAIVAGAPAGKARDELLNMGTEPRSGRVPIKDIAQRMQAARDAQDDDLLSREAELAWRSYTASGEEVPWRTARDLFLLAGDFGVRSAIFQKFHEAFYTMASKGDFSLLTGIEALNRDGMKVHLQSLRVDEAALIGASLTVVQALNTMASEMAASKLLSS